MAKNKTGCLLAAGCLLLLAVGCRAAQPPDKQEGVRTTSAAAVITKSTALPVQTSASTRQPAAELAGVWELIQPDANGSLVYRYTFDADGTVGYMAGWYLSEAALTATGRYTYDGNTLSMELAGQTSAFGTEKGEAVALESRFTARLAGKTLELTLQSGDEPNFIQSKGKTVAFTKGSSAG